MKTLMMPVVMLGTVVTMSNEETSASALICFVSCRWMGRRTGTRWVGSEAPCGTMLSFEHAEENVLSIVQMGGALPCCSTRSSADGGCFRGETLVEQVGKAMWMKKHLW